MRILIIVFVFLFISGCAINNGYKDSYQSSAYDKKNIKDSAKLDFLEKGDSPKIINVKNFDYGVFDYELNKGYVLIGTSSFTGPYESNDNVVFHGKEIGSTLVLVSHTHKETISRKSGIVLPVNKTTYHSGTISGEYFSGTSTTTEYQYVPYVSDIKIYKHQAAFFVKRKTK